MKGLILSGGRGTRLRPLTYTSAKQLVPVANKPILFFAIEAIRDADITDIGIVVGDTYREVMGAVGDGARWGVKVTYLHQEEPLGLAHAVLISRDFLKDDPFVMFLGDNLILHGIRDLVQEFRERRPNSQILLAHVPNPQQFGVAEIEGSTVVRLVEKPKEPKSDLALVGVYMFDQTIFEATENIRPSWRNELEITDAIQWLIDQGRRVDSHIITGWWKDTGRLEDVLEANRIILDTFETRLLGEVDSGSEVHFKVVIEAGAQVVNSTIRGPAIIGAESRIMNSYVGPFTSIGNGVTIRNSEIEHSIVLEGSTIADIDRRIVDSLVGRNVEVSRSDHKPKAYRFMLGDASRVSIE